MRRAAVIVLLSLWACEPPPKLDPKPVEKAAKKVQRLEAAPLIAGDSEFLSTDAVGGGKHLAVLSRATQLQLCEFSQDLGAMRCVAQSSESETDKRTQLAVFAGRVSDRPAGVPAKAHGKRGHAPETAVLFKGIDVRPAAVPDAAVLADETYVVATTQLNVGKSTEVVARVAADGVALAPDPVVLPKRDSPGWLKVALPWVFIARQAADKSTITALRVPAFNEPFVAPQAVATVPAGRMAGACRFGSDVALVIHGAITTVVFERNGKFTQVDAGNVPLASRPDPIDKQGRIDCDDGAVVMSWIKPMPARAGKVPRSGLYQVTCSPAGCSRWKDETFFFPGTAPAVRVGQSVSSKRVSYAAFSRLAGKPLLVWSGKEGIRVVHGDLKQLSPVSVSNTVGPIGIYVREQGAVAVMTGKDQKLRAVRIDRGGVVTAVRMK